MNKMILDRIEEYTKRINCYSPTWFPFSRQNLDMRRKWTKKKLTKSDPDASSIIHSFCIYTFDGEDFRNGMKIKITFSLIFFFLSQEIQLNIRSMLVVSSSYSLITATPLPLWIFWICHFRQPYSIYVITKQVCLAIFPSKFSVIVTPFNRWVASRIFYIIYTSNEINKTVLSSSFFT